MKSVSRRIASLLALFILTATPLLAATSNGNDFALALDEARSDEERASIVQDAMGRPHYFRYIYITSMQEGETGGRPRIAIAGTEPASTWQLTFAVTKPVSLSKLAADPATSVHDAIAVTGKIAGVDVENRRITLDPVIVRHKDRLTPKRGKELFTELDPDAICYSYTAVAPAVLVPTRHSDLLKHKNRILKNEGREAWAEFLRTELAKRTQAK